MSKPIWLLYGGHGWIGGQFIRTVNKLYPSISLVCGDARCDDTSAVTQEMDRVKPDRVISMIGRTSGARLEEGKGTDQTTIDFLELPGNLRLNLRDNMYAPLVIQKICEQKSVHFTYLGTGCIFSYGSGDPLEKLYREDNDPDFFGSSYSVVKGFTDRYMRSCANTLNVRIRMPVTEDQESSKNTISKLLAYRQTVADSTNSMTVLPDLLPHLAEIVAEGKVGTIHLVNPGHMSHVEILSLYRDIVDPSFTWNVVSEQNLGTMLRAARSKCVLDSSDMRQRGVPSLRDSLTSIFRTWSKS